MYKLMIVEDEPLARAAIMKSIDFASNDFEVVAVCEDGKEAADLYLKLLPDLVITDICMPVMNGLQLAAMIAEAGRGTRVVIITGYNDFNYARSAISSKVSEYILKPVTSREFAEVLANSKKALDEQAERRKQIDSAKHRLYVVSPIVRDSIMNRLIQGSIEAETAGADLRSFGLDTERKYYLLSLFHVEDFEEATKKLNVSAELVHFMVMNIIEELAGEEKGFVSFSLADGKSAVLGFGDDEAALKRNLRSLCRKSRESILETLKLQITIGIGSPAPLARLRESYAEALKCLDYRFLMPSQTIISPEDLRQQGGHYDFDKFRDELVLQIRLRDEDKIRALIDKMIQAVKLSNLSKKDIQYEFSRISARVAAETRAENPEADFSEGPSCPDADGPECLSRMRDWLEKLCMRAVEFLRSGSRAAVQRLTVLAKEYIKEHYAQSDLSLMSVCNYLSVSMSYFGTFFKEQTGKTFIEYLTEVRMEKARELLAGSDLMLYAVADKVGYENAAYFTVAFKKNNGMSPKEYRKAFGRKDR